MNNWQKEFPGTITICDAEGIIVYMNDKSIKMFEPSGGEKLISTNLLDCHPEPAKTKLKELLKNHTLNTYTTEKKGVKKFVYQSPFYEDGIFKGIVELGLEIPFKLPHFIRDKS
jgi:transcriptional regulator with PAS, ATPase and Fis domain